MQRPAWLPHCRSHTVFRWACRNSSHRRHIRQGKSHTRCLRTCTRPDAVPVGMDGNPNQHRSPNLLAAQGDNIEGIQGPHPRRSNTCDRSHSPRRWCRLHCFEYPPQRTQPRVARQDLSGAPRSFVCRTLFGRSDHTCPRRGPARRNCRCFPWSCCSLRCSSRCLSRC